METVCRMVFGTVPSLAHVSHNLGRRRKPYFECQHSQHGSVWPFWKFLFRSHINILPFLKHFWESFKVILNLSRRISLIRVLPDFGHKTVSPSIAWLVSEWPVADPISFSKGKDPASVRMFKEMCSIAPNVSSKGNVSKLFYVVVVKLAFVRILPTYLSTWREAVGCHSGLCWEVFSTVLLQERSKCCHFWLTLLPSERENSPRLQRRHKG